ncbi:hypothetical protein ACFLSQ_00690 [Bacteroidota bacterium]
MKEYWTVESKDYGLHFSSKDQIENSKGQMISAVTLDMEGPVETPEGVTTKDAVEDNLDNILRTTPVNPHFKPSFPIGEGFGGAIVDINGQEVGFIEYEVLSDNIIFVRHGIIIKEQKMYAFTMIFFDPKVDRKKGMYMEMLIIAAVNSGKL